MLSVKQLKTFHGRKIEALRGVDLQIASGEIVSLIGGNGAGKSTLLKSIAGLLAPESGEILFEGASIRSLQPHQIAALGIRYVPEGRHVFPRLTVQENLEMGAYLNPDKAQIRADLERYFQLFPVLRERHTQLALTLSGGEQQMLAMARALMGHPKVLMLDEPSMGLSPIMVDRIFQTIQQIHQQGMTILLVEQNAIRALEISQRAYVLETGKIVMQGPARELLCDSQIQKSYLGIESVL